MPQVNLAYGGVDDGWVVPNLWDGEVTGVAAGLPCSGLSASVIEEGIYHLAGMRRFSVGGPAQVAVGTDAVQLAFYGVYPDFCDEVQCVLRFITASPLHSFMARLWTAADNWSDWKEAKGSPSVAQPVRMTLERKVNATANNSSRGLKAVLLQAKVVYNQGQVTGNGKLYSPRLFLLPAHTLTWGTLP